MSTKFIAVVREVLRRDVGLQRVMIQPLHGGFPVEATMTRDFPVVVSDHVHVERTGRRSFWATRCAGCMLTGDLIITASGKCAALTADGDRVLLDELDEDQRKLLVNLRLHSRVSTQIALEAIERRAAS